MENLQTPCCDHGEAMPVAGGLTISPPGAGKSMLARRLTTIVPGMSLAEAVKTTRIHSVAGLTGARTALVTRRPCRAPHHTISDAGLIGGGHVPRSCTSMLRIIGLELPASCDQGGHRLSHGGFMA